jgi:hypothetical protein
MTIAQGWAKARTGKELSEAEAIQVCIEALETEIEATAFPVDESWAPVGIENLRARLNDS